MTLETWTFNFFHQRQRTCVTDRFFSIQFVCVFKFIVNSLVINYWIVINGHRWRYRINGKRLWILKIRMKTSKLLIKSLLFVFKFVCVKKVEIKMCPISFVTIWNHLFLFESKYHRISETQLKQKIILKQGAFNWYLINSKKRGRKYQYILFRHAIATSTT